MTSISLRNSSWGTGGSPGPYTRSLLPKSRRTPTCRCFSSPAATARPKFSLLPMASDNTSRSPQSLSLSYVTPLSEVLRRCVPSNGTLRATEGSESCFLTRYGQTLKRNHLSGLTRNSFFPITPVGRSLRFWQPALRTSRLDSIFRGLSVMTS